MRRILVAVEDSPAGLAAGRTAIEIAADWSGEVRAVHVLSDGIVDVTLGTQGDAADVRARRDAGAWAVLRHVAALAGRAGVPTETLVLHGRPAASILEQAAAWPADCVVIGRVGTARLGRPYVGSVVHHVLEFSEVPVLVVPPP